MNTGYPGLTLVVMAAGMGNRYGGLKQLDGVGPGGTTLLEYNVYDAMRAGIKRVVFIIRREFEDAFKQQVTHRFSHQLQVDYVFQEFKDLPLPLSVDRKKPWGTGHAVWAARHVLQGPFIVINADDYYGPSGFRALATFLQKSPDSALMGYRLRNTMPRAGCVSRGLCEMAPNGTVAAIREYPKIQSTEDPAYYLDASGARLPADAFVSINCWGFQGNFIQGLEAAFLEFFKQPRDFNSAEFYLSEAVYPALHTLKQSLHLIPTEERWFGMTYAQDRDWVARELLQAVNEGRYPAQLWAQ